MNMDFWDVLETIMGLDIEDISGMDRDELGTLISQGWYAYENVDALSPEEDEKIEDQLIRMWDTYTYK